jgi:hypothetical protein
MSEFDLCLAETEARPLGQITVGEIAIGDTRTLTAPDVTTRTPTRELN